MSNYWHLKCECLSHNSGSSIDLLVFNKNNKKSKCTKLMGGGQGEGPPIGFKEITRVEESYQHIVYFLIKANV